MRFEGSRLLNGKSVSMLPPGIDRIVSVPALSCPDKTYILYPQGRQSMAEAPRTTDVTQAPTVHDVREFIGLCLAWYWSDTHLGATEFRIRRRENQIMALAEVLRWLDGNTGTLDELRSTGLIPLDLDDLPQRLGGRSTE